MEPSTVCVSLGVASLARVITKVQSIRRFMHVAVCTSLTLLACQFNLNMGLNKNGALRFTLTKKKYAEVPALNGSIGKERTFNLISG